MSIVEELGDRLASDTLAAMETIDDDRFYEKVGRAAPEAPKDYSAGGH